jgi:hypothetical protein
VVRQIADRLGPFEVALLFAGGAQTALVAPAFLTLTSELAAEAARILGEPQVVPVRFEGWTHYRQQADTLRHAFGAADLSSRLHVLDPGEWIELYVTARQIDLAQGSDQSHLRVTVSHAQAFSYAATAFVARLELAARSRRASSASATAALRAAAGTAAV